MLRIKSVDMAATSNEETVSIINLGSVIHLFTCTGWKQLSHHTRGPHEPQRRIMLLKTFAVAWSTYLLASSRIHFDRIALCLPRSITVYFYVSRGKAVR